MSRGRLAEPVAATAVAVAALAIAAYAGVKNFAAVPEVLRAAGGTLLLTSVAGYAPARVLVPRALWSHFPWLVCLVGCASAGLGLTILGFLGLPFEASLAVLLGSGGLAGAALRLRLGPARPAADDLAASGGRRYALVWPSYLAMVLVALLVTPLFANGYATVQGTNPDAMLGAGSAKLLQHTGPNSAEEDLPVDRMPLVWRSKYPIYYVLAGASSLSGLDPTESFAVVAAVLGALTAAAFMLLARYALGAGPRTAVLVMAMVGLDRAVAYLALHPYYNQLWGTMALAPILLFGLRLLQQPTRRDALLLAAFLLVGLAAYPLMVLFPVLALGAAAAIQRRRGLLRIRRPRLPRSRAGRAAWLVAALVAAPAILVVGVGVLEKAASAADLLVSGSSLSPWRGDLRHYPSAGFFIGVDGAVGHVAAVGVLLAATAGTRCLPAVPRAAFGAMIAGALGFAVYFRLREFGEYFYFKVLAFLAPLVLVVAAVWLATRVSRSSSGRLALAVTLALLAVQFAGLRREVAVTGLQLDAETLQLRDVADRLPPGSSLRVDVLPDGRQLWVGYMLNEHPLSTLSPLTGTTFPHIPRGRKADYIVADARLRAKPWPDAAGPPIFENDKFRVYRMQNGVPGEDRSSKRMIDRLSESFE